MLLWKKLSKFVAAFAMADPSDSAMHPQPPVHQQGMSPTLDGENSGPPYGGSPGLLRHQVDARDEGAVHPLPNGVPSGARPAREDQAVQEAGTAVTVGVSMDDVAGTRQISDV